MDQQQKVMWTDGMFLTPHHFQQQDRYLHSQMWSYARAIQHLSHGFSQLQIDEDALAVGDFLVIKAAGVFPDGLSFAMPDIDEPPPGRALGALFGDDGGIFDTQQGAQGVYLAIPSARTGVRVASDEGLVDGVATRYRTATIAIRDENAVGNEQELQLARKNVRILLEGESLEGYSVLKIAEVMRDSTGRVVLNQDYVPPVLSIRAAPRLELVIRRVQEVLTARSHELAAQRRDRGSGLVDYAMSESANFSLLAVINTFIPALRHYYHQTGVHPEAVYTELAKLAGALCTFSATGAPDQLPLYHHDDLSHTFLELERVLQDLISVVIPTRSLRLPQKLKDDAWFEVSLPEDAQPGHAYYLGVAADLSGERLIAEVPLKVKIASAEVIDFFIAQGLRGVGVEYLSTPPQELPINPDWKYFQVLGAGDQWDEIITEGKLGVYLPGEFRNLRLECYVVKG